MISGDYTNLCTFMTLQTSCCLFPSSAEQFSEIWFLLEGVKGEGMIEREGKEKFNCPTISVCLS
jgi:hypothetical protein